MDMFPLRLSVFARYFQLSVKSPLDFVQIKTLPNAPFFPYRIPRFFFSMITCISTEAAQSGQTYRFVVSLKSGSWVWWQLGHFIISGLSSRGLDIH